MPGLLLDIIHSIKDSVWGGIAVIVAILIPTLGFAARTIRGRAHEGSHPRRAQVA